MKTIRLNHFLSSCGVCARRKAGQLIKNKKVTVNNKLTINSALTIYPEKDIVKVEGKKIHLPQAKWYIAFNKPKKVLTTMSDPKNRPCIADFFIPKGGARAKGYKPLFPGQGLNISKDHYSKQGSLVFPVGRLDWHSEGLILLTNDGRFSALLTKQKTPKTYFVKLNGQPTAAQLIKLTKGVYTEVGRLKAVYAQRVRGRASGRQAWVKVILTEGRNRQLHRMFEKIGFQIKVLRRTAIGRLKLRSLKPGGFFMLSPEDIKKVFSQPSELK